MYSESSRPNKCPNIEKTSAPTIGCTQDCYKKSGKRGKQKQASIATCGNVKQNNRSVQKTSPNLRVAEKYKN